MRILCDECVDHQLIKCLRELGHDVSAIFENLSGVPDHEVLELSASQSRILLTEDYDFGELLIRNKRIAFGVVIIAPEVLNGAAIGEFQDSARRLSELGSELNGRLTIMEIDRARQRQLPQG